MWSVVWERKRCHELESVLLVWPAVEGFGEPILSSRQLLVFLFALALEEIRAVHGGVGLFYTVSDGCSQLIALLSLSPQAD